MASYFHKYYQKLFVILILFQVKYFVNAQNYTLSPENYSCAKLLSYAQQEFYSKNYQKASHYYSKAFRIKNSLNLDIHYYNAACCNALIAKKLKSLKLLSKLVKNGYSNYEHIKSDKDLISISSTKKFKYLLKDILKNSSIEKLNYNLKYKKSLDSLYFIDQKYRLKLDSISRIGNDPISYSYSLKELKINDSLNLISLKNLIFRYGWPNRKEVSPKSALAAFLIIQHSEVNIQKSFYPIILKATQEKKIAPYFIAYLIDRILEKENNIQIFGTQYLYEYETKIIKISPPLKYKNEVDIYRASVSLIPLEKYLEESSKQ